MNDEMQVRTLLREYAQRAPAPGSVTGLWDRGRARRRSGRITSVGVVVAVTVVIVLAYAGLDGRLSSEPIPPASPSPSPSPSPSETKKTEVPKGPPVFKWAKGLPRGADARAVFDVGGVLHVGGKQFPMPGVPRWHNAVYASMPNGWLISWGKCASGPLCGVSAHGLMSPDGSLTEFPYPRTGARETYAVSPDGESVIFDRWILDANTGEVIADLPHNVGYINAWTPNGIVYFGEKSINRQWWWQPGSQPIRVQEPANYRSDGLGIESNRDCSIIQRLREGGGAEVLMEYCGGDYLSALSPSGTRAVTDTGLIIDVPSGRKVGSLNVPDNFASEFSPTSMLWEDADNILYLVEDYKATFRKPMLIVRCNVTSGRCERASDTLSDYTSQLHLVPLDPAAPRDGTT